MSDPTILALQRLVEREGGYKIVADAIGANDQSIYQICSGVKTPAGKPKGVGKDLRERLQRKYPDWLQLAGPVAGEQPPAYTLTVQTITPGPSGADQNVSQLTARIAPPKIGWEALSMTDLPPEFETTLPDNAMSPAAPRGARVIFVTGVEPEAGDWVLLSDKHGGLACREMRTLRPGHWEAHAVNPAVLPLDSVRDGLRILAVYDGMRGRRAPR